MVRAIDRRDLLKSAGAAGLAGLAGCIGQGPGGGGGYTAKLGILQPLTGDLASVGKPIKDAGVLAATQVQNADTTTKVDYQVEDTQTNPQAGIQAADTLVQAGYPMVNGPASSGVNMQVTQQSLIPNGVVGCSPSSTSPNVTTLDDNDLIFRTAPSDALQGQVMAQVASGELNASSASVMFVNNDYGQALAGVFADSFGGTVQEEVAFKKEKSSYSSELSTAMGGDPDTLVIIGYPASGIQIFRDYYAEYSAKKPILVTDGLQASSLPDEVGNDMKNVYGTAPLPSGPGNKAFAQLYKDEFGRAPGVFNAHAYDSSAVLLLANVAAQKNDGKAVSKKMRTVANPNDGMKVTPANLPKGVDAVANGDSVHYVGASSAVDFDKNGDMKAVSYSFWKFDTSVDGNIKTLKKIQFGM